MANTEDQVNAAAPSGIEKLYTDILGRASDPGGFKYWQQQFGDEVDPNELATFKLAAQAELANRTPTEQTALAPNLVSSNTVDPLGYDKLVKNAYATYAGLDPNTIDANNEGLNYWKTQLNSGALKPQDFNNAFSYAVNQYATEHPDYKPPTPAPETPTNFNANAYLAANKDVSDAYNVNNYGMTPEQFALYHYQNYGAQEHRPSDANVIYDKIVKDTYATELGLDPKTIDANNAGLNYWKSQLASGAVKPQDFQSVFENSANEYVKSHPSDAASTYFQNHRLEQQKDTLKTNFDNFLQDKAISLDEAKKITEYQNKYNFSPEQLASATGYSLDTVKQVLGSQNNILTNTVKANKDNPLALATFATQNGFNAKQLADASGGAFTEASAQDFINKSQSFQGRLEMASPDAYNQIKNLTQYTANENFGGKTQDYQVQLFTPLDTTKTGIPTQLEFTKPSPITAIDPDTGNPYTYTPQPQVKNPNVTRDDDGNFVSTTPTYVNGVPVFASYDDKGKITGYKGDPRVVTWLDGSHYVYGNWDAQGNAKPAQVATKGGGFIKNIASDIAGGLKDLGPAWIVAKFLQPELNLVDFATSIGQGKFDLGTAVSGLSGYAGVQSNIAGAGLDPASLEDLQLGNSMTALTTGINPGLVAASNASTAKLVASSLVAIDAADKGNYAPILNVVANVSGANKMPEVAFAANTLAAVDAINKNSPGALMTAAGNLVNSPDLKVAGAATKFIQAYNSGNQAAITTSGAELFSSINANVPEASKILKNLVSDATSAISPTKTPTAPLSTGNTITYDQSGNPTSTPATDVIKNLTNAGLTETPPTGVDATKYTNVDVQDISAGIQVAGPGGLPENAFKPNGITQTATGLFFTTPDGKTFPISVNKETGEVTSLDPANAETVKQLRINDTSAIKPVFFDKTPLDVPMSFDELLELSKVTGKSDAPAPDITDVKAKDIVSAAKSGASISSLLKMIGGADVAESAIGIDALMNIPGIKDAMNAGYINDLADHLAKDPNNDAWLSEYKKITGMDYSPPVTDLGKVEIIAKGEKGNDRVVALDKDGNEVTLGDLLKDMEVKKTPFVAPDVPPVVTTAPTTTPTSVVTPTVTTPPAVTVAPAVPPVPPPVQPPVVTPPVEPPIEPPIVNPQVSLVPTVVSPPVPPVQPPVVTPPVEPPVVTPPVQPPPVAPPVPPVEPVKPPPVTPAPPVEPPVVTPPPTVTPPPVVTPPSKVTPPATVTPPTNTPTTTAQSTGLNFGQVQQALAAAGIPQLANVFYYGKEFGAKRQKLDKKGELDEEEYRPLSVTKAGAQGELQEQVAEQAKTKENDINTALDHIIGKSSQSTSLDDLLNIVKGA